MGSVRSSSSQRENSVECYLVLLLHPPAQAFIVVSGADQIGPRPASSRPAQLLHRDEDVLVHHYNNTLDHNIHCYDDHDHETMGMRPWVMGSVLVHP